MDGILTATLLTAGVVFVAELGDKSQLMAMTFATRFRPLPVLLGISLGAGVAHAISVGVGVGLGAALPTAWIGLGAAALFLFFAAWSLREEDEEESGGKVKIAGSAVLTVALAFFLSELGDKTMLATMAMAAREQWLGVWIGAVLGMVAVDALAILVGLWLRKKLPEKPLRLISAGLFAVFGIWIGVESVLQLVG